MPDRVKVGLVLDCVDPEGLAPFWGDALGYVSVGTFGPYVALLPDGRDGPRLLLQRVPEVKAGKNRVHFDVESADIEGTAARLEGLGATRLLPDVQSEQGSNWIVMADPEGNEFCVCDGGG